MDLSFCTNSSLTPLLNDVNENDFIAIEDIDSVKAVLARKDKEYNSSVETGEYLTLSAVLNAFDGLVPLDGSVIFITTNHLDKLDSALIRKGRIDEVFEIKALTDIEIKEFIKDKFDVEETTVVFKDIKGCDLQDLYIQHYESYETFKSHLEIIYKLIKHFEFFGVSAVGIGKGGEAILESNVSANGEPILHVALGKGNYE
jgi:hypothetical protein